MTMEWTCDTLKERLLSAENEHCEFKKAQHGFDKDTLADYCAALANEGGGDLVLGVVDKAPRTIVGSNAFHDLNEVKLFLLDKLKVRVNVTELQCDGKRVLIFHAPPRPKGKAIGFKGRFQMRSGESLVPMPFEMLAAITEEGTLDRSQETIAGATLQDLSSTAIQRFRDIWSKKTGNREVALMEVGRLLHDAGLINDRPEHRVVERNVFGA